MNRAAVLSPLLLAAVLAGPAAGQEGGDLSLEPDYTSGFAVGPSVRVHFLTLDGDAYADENASFGTGIDFDDDLGLDNTATAVELGGKLGWWDAWSPNLNFRYGIEIRGMWGGFSDRQTLRNTEEFDGTVLPGGTSVRSRFEFDLTQFHGTAGWMFGSAERWSAEVQLFLGASILGCSVEMDPSGAPTVREGLRLVPFGGGIRASFAPCPWFDIGGSAAYYGTHIEWDDWDYDSYEETSELVDLSVRASIRPMRYAAIEVGYRFLDAYLFMERIDDDFPFILERKEREFDWTLHGWYVGASIRF